MSELNIDAKGQTLFNFSVITEAFNSLSLVAMFKNRRKPGFLLIVEQKIFPPPSPFMREFVNFQPLMISKNPPLLDYLFRSGIANLSSWVK